MGLFVTSGAGKSSALAAIQASGRADRPSHAGALVSNSSPDGAQVAVGVKYGEVAQILFQQVAFNAPWRISARVMNETTNSKPRGRAGVSRALRHRIQAGFIGGARFSHVQIAGEI